MKTIKNAIKKPFGLFLTAFLVMSLGAVGCGSDDDDPIIDPDSTYLRVLHLSPDAPAVDVFANGELKAVENLAFGEGTDYLTLDEGTYDFQIAATGGTAADAVITVDGLMLDGEKNYTAVAIGQLANLQVLALEDDFSGLGSDMIRVRPIHAADGVGQVDIWNIPAEGEPSILYENVNYGAVGDYMDLPAGAYTIGFDADNDANPEFIIQIPELPGGIIANLFAVIDGEGEFNVQAQLQDSAVVRLDPVEIQPENAGLRVIHLSPDAPLVDIYVDGGLAFEDVAFKAGTAYAELEAGTYDIDIVPAGGVIGDSVLSIPGLELMADSKYTAVAYDEVGMLKAMALMDDEMGVPADSIRLRAIHTAVGVGQVDIWNIPAEGAPTALYENVDFGVAGSYLDLPVGAYTIGFDVNDDASPDVIFNVPELPAGTVANVFAVTDADGNLSLQAQLDSSAIAELTPAIAEVRVLHLSPDAPAVDVLVNSANRAFENLAFDEGTGWAQLMQGTYTFDVVPNGADVGSSVLNIPGMMLADGASYTAVAFDVLDNIQGLWLEDDFSQVPADTIRIRAIHTASIVGEVDIWNIPMSGDPAIIYENVPFGGVGEYLELPAGAYTLGFDLDNDASPDVIFETPELAAGTVANIFAVSDSDSNVYLRAQLEDGTLVRIDPAI